MHRFSGFVFMVAACAGSLAAEPRTVIDDFESYSGDAYIQAQNARWSRFGLVTVDGLYSIDKGADGRGAEYSVDWAAGRSGYIRHNFENYLPFFLSKFSDERGGIGIALDIATVPVNSGTRVHLLLADGDPEKPGTTIYRTRVARELTHEGFATVAFVIDADSVMRLQGTATLGDVLPNLSSLTFQFTNESGTGAQIIRLDNFAISSGETLR